VDGTPFGRYLLLESLGRGGMGEVWRAHDTETDRVVAVKLLHSYLSADEEFQRRFRREAHAAASLNNPHVIPIHHYGEIDGRLYVDMRLVEGRDLETALIDGPLDTSRAVRIVEQVAGALHAAHKVGLLHRDIKPSNVLLDDDDFAYLIDFGISRTTDETRMTESGTTVGTFAYIAPERLDPQTQEDARADIYSLACVLYEALTGQPPFPGSTTAHLITAHLTAPPPRPSIGRPDVPLEVDDVIATGMAKDPNDRYASTIELADAARDAITDPIPHPIPDPVKLAAVTRRRRPKPSVHEARPQLRAAIAATGALVTVGIIGLTGHLLLTYRSQSHTATGQPAPQPNPLNGLLLSAGQIDTAMGTTGMSPVGSMTTLTDNSFAVPDQACLPLSAAAETKVYANSGYLDVRAQVVAKDQQNAVNQSVVLFSSPQAAGSFFAASATSWQDCSNRQFTISANGNSQVNTVGTVSDTGGVLSATVTPANSLGVCERALTAAGNVVVDVTACSGPTGAAINVAHQIAARVPGR
jgi:serine/threonine kinase PknH